MKQRIIPGVVMAALAVAGVLLLPPLGLFAMFLVLCVLAMIEFVAIAGNRLPLPPLRTLWLWVPLVSVLGLVMLRQAPAIDPLVWSMTWFLAPILAAFSVMSARAPLDDGLMSIGTIGFAIPYFAVPPIAAYWIQTIDPWLTFLVLAVVAVGDSAAYFTGRALGRHKLAPVISPKKTWEGSLGGVVGAGLVAAIWCLLRLGELSFGLLLLAMATQVSAQFGDLCESLIKRSAGVKDSSNILPGHGGFYDRLDAMLFAAPTFAVGLWWTGIS